MSTVDHNLDGNGMKLEAKATGHVCDWPCLTNHNKLCDQYEEESYLRMKQEMVNFAKRAISKGPSKFNIDPLKDYDFNYTFLNDLGLIPKPRRKHRGIDLGPREFTLTYSPKWFDDTEARAKMTMAIDKLLRYYNTELETLRAVGEVGSNGLSHVHCFYKLKTGNKITDKNFKRAWPYWNPKKIMGKGFEGGHHANVKEESDFLGYIEKDIATSWLDKLFSQKMDITDGPTQDPE